MPLFSRLITSPLLVADNESYRLFLPARPLWHCLCRCRRSRSMVESLLRLRRQPRWSGSSKTCNWRQRHLAVGFFHSPSCFPFLCKPTALRPFLLAPMTHLSCMRPTTLITPALFITMACSQIKQPGTMVLSPSPSVVFRMVRRSLMRLISPTRANGALTGFMRTPM
jgi:hypothetical protein